MTDIFLKILNMSISASFVCAAVVVARLMLRRAPRWIMLLLWLAVAVRLVCPIAFESDVSVMPMADTVPQNIGVADTPAIHSGIEPLNNAVNPLLQTDTLAPDPTNSANPMQIVTFIASIVWVAGICLMILYTLISYIRLKLRVRESIPANGEKRVRLCDSITSPFILGFVRPVIYLPSNIDESDADHVLAHERCHIKRLDFIWKPIGFVLLALHWFNPFIWVAYVLLCRDIESACDEAVLKSRGSEIKADYATALINCSVSRKSIAACPLAFGETGLKTRVRNVLSYKKPTVWLIAAGLIVCAAVGIFLLTDPASISITEIYEDETGYYTHIFDGVETLTVYQGKLTHDVYDADTVTDVIDTLKEVRLKKRPISKDRSDGRDMTNRVQLGDGKQLCFSEDYGEFWIYTGTKPTLSYKVMNPEVAESAVVEKSYFSSEVGFTSGMIGSDDDSLSARIISIMADARGGYLEVMFKNLFSDEVTYGDKFALYRYNEDGELVSCMDENKVFDLIGYSLKGHSSVTHKYYLDGCDLSKSAKYRFETELTIGYDGFVQTYGVWAEFTLSEGGVPSEEPAISPLRTGTLYVYSDDRSGYYIEPHIFLSDINNSCVFTGTSFLSSATLIGTYVLDSDNLVITHVAPEYETKYVFDVDGEGNLIFNESLSTAPPIPSHVDENDVIPLYNDGTMFKKLKKVEDSSYMEVFSELAENAKFLDDSKTFDIDRDGNEEDCYLIDGGLSGVSSLELIVVDEYNTKYCLFYTFVPTGKYSFEECDDGEIRLKINISGDDRFSDGTEIFYDIGIDEDGYITFTNGEDSLLCNNAMLSDNDLPSREEMIEDGDEKCEHSYEMTQETSATCLSAGSRTYTCKVCNDTYSEEAPSLGHIFATATCTSPSICTVCSATEGEALPHTLTWATCTVPATCTVCGTTVGDTVPHSYTEATCTAPATCSVCGEVNGTALDHDFSNATMDAPKTCRTCGATEGEALPKLTIDMTSYVAKTVSVTVPTIVYDRYGRPTSDNSVLFQMNILDLSYDIIGYNEETGYELQMKLKAQKNNSSETSKHKPIGMVDGYIMESPDSEYAVEGLYWTFTDCFEGDIVEGSVTVSVPPGNYYFLVKEEIPRVSLARSGEYKWPLKVNDITSIETPQYIEDTIDELKANITN